MRCQFTLKDWRRETGQQRFSLALWKTLTGLKKFTLKAWCDFVEQDEPAPYHADAVHFDGAGNYLSIASLTCPQNRVGGFSFWLKIGAAGLQPAHPSLWFADINELSTQFGVSDINTSPTIGYEIASAGSVGLLSNGASAVSLETWYNFIGAWNSDAPAGDKVCLLYQNGSPVTLTAPKFDPSAAFTPAFNGFDFYLGDDTFGDGLVSDVADFRFFPGVDFLDGGSTIPQEIIDLFIGGGKPVNPTVASSYFGTAGAILFSGDATAFATNQGTGGAFTLTGSLTNASTSPSD